MEAPKGTRRIARLLRRRMTLPEVLLWIQLKGRKLDGLQFRRQHPVGAYVLDFYCEAAKLCVEVDGQGHDAADRPKRDAERDDWLSSRGVRTLRLSATLVLSDMDAAVRTIRTVALES